MVQTQKYLNMQAAAFDTAMTSQLGSIMGLFSLWLAFYRKKK